ncbi:hypothetical protein K443DRAFT_135562 [Laccaria amethystina LaAM-08-1]|uniref:Uncharacterized protein n=1 Tax=Laccaria amethystina LaAM-08-1 TaxID=1095629 RepID=A0A0C9WHF3_9AGAR|nr:hypothetical protein K443DRAFT_135562 [Laccaria amethystina LaAM-08-1]
MSSSPPPADAPTATLPADTPPAVQSVPVPVDIPVESHPSSPQISPLPTGAEPETSRTYQLGPATHADSNSATFVQPVKKLSKLSDTQKASQKLRRQIAQEAHEKLIKEFNVLIERHSNEQADLVKRHDVKPEYLDKLKGTSKHFNAKREANLENSKLHKKSLEVNADRAVGDRLHINDIRQLVKDDPDLQNLSKAQEAELREELTASREEKKRGARPTNRSAAQDYHRHLEWFNDEINSLAACTGAAAVCFFTRTSLEDGFEPNWICSPNAANFAEDSLGRNMWDITRLFEQWACTMSKVRKPDSLASLREQCSKLINGGLKTASKLGTAAMNYQNYNTQVIERLGVKLVGWTHNKLVSPYEIHSVDDLRMLHNALVCGACFWMRLSKREMTRHKVDMEEREAAGEVVVKKRKARSDKGIPKGPRKKPGRGRPIEEEEATKRAGAAKAKSQVPPSNEYIEDSDLE